MDSLSSKASTQTSKIYQCTLYMLRFLTIEPVRICSITVYSPSKIVCNFPTIPMGNVANRKKYLAARDLLMEPTLVELLQIIQLFNWTRATNNLCPVIVPGDGNSLCHACSVLLYGIPDLVLLLRRCLNQTLAEHHDIESAFAKRWIHYFTTSNARITFSKMDLEREWSKVLEKSSIQPLNLNSRSSKQYSDLTSFHIFVLCHILRRPIIVVTSEETDQCMSSIYLPVMFPPSECVKSFVYIVWHQQQFTPLIFSEIQESDVYVKDLCVPLVTNRFKQFKVPYLCADEDPEIKIREYLFTTCIGFTTFNTLVEIPAARMPKNETKKDSFSIDPSLMFRVCYQPLQQGCAPTCVPTNWKICLDTKDEFADCIPAPDVQLSESYPAESDFVDEFDDLSPLAKIVPKTTSLEKNIRTSARNEHETNLSNVFINSDQRVESGSIHGLQSYACSNSTSMEFHSSSWLNETTFDNNFPAISSSSSLARGASYQHSVSSELADAMETKCNSLTNDASGVQMSVMSQSLENDSSSMPAITVHHGSNYNASNISSNYDADNEADFPDLNTLQQPRMISYSSDFSVQHSSPSSVVVQQCSKVTLAMFQLCLAVSSLIVHKVTAKLEKVGLGDDKGIKLFINSPRNVKHIYKMINEDMLTMQLLSRRPGFLQLLISHPRNVTTEIQTNELIPSLNEPSNSFVDIATHRQKCRTAGCMNRGVMQHKNLCNVCYKTWEDLRRRRWNSNNILDSSSATESYDENKTCKSRDCSETGETRYYGYCYACFHKPGM